MAYTEPPAVNTNDLAVATDWNTYIRDNAIHFEANKQGTFEILVYEDQKASGVDGGTFTQGAWRTRVLNTEVRDTGGNGALAANQVTLDAGTYLLCAWAAAFDVDEHQVMWYNITDATEELLGLNCMANDPSTVETSALVQGHFTIAASKAFELQHRCVTTQADDGFGEAGAWGTEVYSQIMLTKIA